MTKNLLHSKSKSKILIIDDDDSLCSSITLNLNHAGFTCISASSAEDAFARLSSGDFAIVLSDLQLPEMNGLDFTRACSASHPEVDIVVMTGFGGTETALEAIQAGASDYISKPFVPEDLLLTLRKIEERALVNNKAKHTDSDTNQEYDFSNIIAQSKTMKDVFATVKRLAAFNTTVLICGESGTGKELLARAIHHNSPRQGQPFIAINCGAIPENLIESELFGHKKGSFTDASRDKTGLFEEANGGTIFLDEIGELPVHLQVKLLRVLQEQQIQPVGEEKTRDIDVRVIAATLKNLEEAVEQGDFRDDLYYRLNVVSITLPPLRERPEDVPVLVEHFLHKHNAKLGTNIEEIEADAMKCLMAYSWKGNVRELENCIERALVLTESKKITIDSLPQHIQQTSETPQKRPLIIGSDSLSIKQQTKILEYDLIVRALEETKGNRTHAAKILEISHRALLYKLKEFGLQ